MTNPRARSWPDGSTAPRVFIVWASMAARRPPGASLSRETGSGADGYQPARSQRHRVRAPVEAASAGAPSLSCSRFTRTPTIFSTLCPPGATGYLLKRASRQSLLAALQDVHAGGSPMTSSIARKIVQSFRQSAVRRACHARSLPARAGGAGVVGPRLCLQRNCRRVRHQRHDRQHLCPPHL